MTDRLAGRDNTVMHVPGWWRGREKEWEAHCAACAACNVHYGDKSLAKVVVLAADLRYLLYHSTFKVRDDENVDRDHEVFDRIRTAIEEGE